MKRAFGTAILASLLAFGLVSSAWSAGDTGTSTTAPSGKDTKKHKSHSKKHTKGKKDDASQTK